MPNKSEEGLFQDSVNDVLEARINEANSNALVAQQQANATNQNKANKAATIESDDAPDAAGSYTQSDIQAMVDLLNEIKAKLNSMNG